jgi:hypothetical protein
MASPYKLIIASFNELKELREFGNEELLCENFDEFLLNFEAELNMNPPKSDFYLKIAATYGVNAINIADESGCIVQNDEACDPINTSLLGINDKMEFCTKNWGSIKNIIRDNLSIF